jgi:hypothetical protein
MEFPKPTDQPLLLSPGGLLDDDDASSAVEPLPSSVSTKSSRKVVKKGGTPN